MAPVDASKYLQGNECLEFYANLGQLLSVPEPVTGGGSTDSKAETVFICRELNSVFMKLESSCYRKDNGDLMDELLTLEKQLVSLGERTVQYRFRA